MIYDETFNYLWTQLANDFDVQATRRMKEYQKKRLKRAQLALAIKSYFLEASWNARAGTVGEISVATTLPTTQPLLAVDGAIRTTDKAFSGAQNNNNFAIQMIRTGGDSRVQPSTSFIKDDHLFTPAQAAILNITPDLGGLITTGLLGQGAPWPLTWPVPMYLAKNELLQLTSQIQTGGVPSEETTFVQFRTVNVNGKNEDDKKVAELRDWINANDLQRPIYLSMVTEGFRSIAYPDNTATARTTAKTMEAQQPLLVIGYSLLFARDRKNAASGNPTLASSNPKWRLQSSDGWSFSKEEIDCNTFAYAGPQFFWQQFAFPFLLPKGSSLSASFSRLNAPDGTDNEKERIDNYVIFRCVTV
jgi:hypothetical protein